MSNGLTAGEFQMMTGLTAKALRLYAERDIVAPASIDPVSGYRYYSRSQLQHGFTVDLLRRARVPLSELATAGDFDFEQRRATVALSRHFEDFYLEVAEKVAAFTAADHVAHSSPAPPVHWVGAVIEMAIPDDMEEKFEAFAALSVDTPAVERVLTDALDELGIPTLPEAWTAGGAQHMILARAVDALPHDLAPIRDHLRAAGIGVEVASGTLPARLEVTFTTAAATDPTPVDEAAAAYLRVLAFEEYVARHGIVPLSASARVVSHAGGMFGGEHPTDVFDVPLP